MEKRELKKIAQRFAGYNWASWIGAQISLKPDSVRFMMRKGQLRPEDAAVISAIKCGSRKPVAIEVKRRGKRRELLQSENR